MNGVLASEKTVKITGGQGGFGNLWVNDGFICKNIIWTEPALIVEIGAWTDDGG